MSEIRDAVYSDTKKGNTNNKFNLELCAEIGFMLEDALEASFKDRCWDAITQSPGLANVERIGEVDRDGILVSPDGVDWDNEVLHEMKFRWAGMPGSMSDDVRTPAGKKFAPVFFQIKTYMAAINGSLGTGITDCLLWVLFANGDYKQNIGPHLRVYHVSYTLEEQEEFWHDVVLATRGDLMGENSDWGKGEK